MNFSQGEIEEVARVLLNHLKTISTNNPEEYNDLLKVIKILINKIEEV